MSDFRKGQLVVTASPINDLTWSKTVPVGAKGTLAVFHRKQNDFEIWTMTLDSEGQSPEVTELLKLTPKRSLVVNDSQVKPQEKTNVKE